MAKGKYEEWLRPEKLVLLEGWARDGLTNEQISHNIGISRETLNQWSRKFSDISDALKKGKEVADREVENALFERAKGGKHEVKKVFKVKREYFDECGRKCYNEELMTKTEEVYIPGDTTAQIFWLKNRKPNEWRDKRVVEDKIELESDGFIEALKGQAKTVFEDAGDVIEE